MYNQYTPYNIFDQRTIQEYSSQAREHDNDQLQKVAKCVQKLNDLMKAMDEVEPGYQGLAFGQCCLAIMKHNEENGRRMGI